ncbi:neurogenic locus notch homolog protein 1-like [Mya arenaria]|uniref:neurogenic locus notch homolog protein 1-like n=1 Tax=Mya arenaria TaxID=6604 RepID=UPI0022E17A9D|nr:neurogenic locus notch homolog protein 1-like [Mya arenaria]
MVEHSCVKYSSFYQETLANSPVHCSAGCRLSDGCLLVWYNRQTHQCRLSDVQQYDMAGNPLGELQSSPDWTTYINGKDDCTPSSCLNGGTCTDAIGSFKCACPTGYMGHRCDVDIDHCASNPCLNGGVCVDGLLSYSCLCPSSYNVGPRCQCPSTWELVQSTCYRIYTNTNNGFVAYRDYSYAAQFCTNFGSGAHLGSVKNESDLNNLVAYTGSSSTFPVYLSGRYSSSNGVFEWHDGSAVDFNWALGQPGITDACMAYYSETDAKSPVHCSAGCRLSDGCLLVSYNRQTHQCRLSDTPQYDLTGNQLAELQSSPDWTTYVNVKDDCTSSTCLNGGTCMDAIGSFICTCPTGYMGYRCDVDIDHCASNPCLNGGVCVDGLMSFTCQCPSSYNVGPRCQCPATWELVQLTCFRVYSYYSKGLVAYSDYLSAAQHCTSFGSAAHLGSVKNESDLNNLKAFTQSSSTFPVFLSARYSSSNGVFEWHDGSALVQATTYMELFKNIPSFKYSSYYQEADAESSVQCSARCRLSDGCLLVSYNRQTRKCRLSDVKQYDLTGNQLAELQISLDWNTYVNINDDCTPSSCLNGGTCTDAIGSFNCACNTSYKGPRCDEDIDECDSNPCLNGGICTNAFISFICACPAGYIGLRCDVHIGF